MLNCSRHLYREVKLKAVPQLWLKKSLTITRQQPPPSTYTISLTTIRNNHQQIIIKRFSHSSQEKLGFCSNYYVCLIRSAARSLSPWSILRKVGVPYSLIVKFRRGLKTFYFPWLLYSVPTGLAMGIGDFLAQMFGFTAQGKEYRKRVALKDIDLYRTAKFAAIGFFLLGPLLSKWNVFISRRLSCNTRQAYIVKRLALDAFVLSPFLILLGLVFWDFDEVYKSYPEVKPVWEKSLKDPFWSIFKFNLMTRPFMDLVINCLAPFCVRKLIRRPYEILFFMYVSSVIAKYRLGEKKKKMFEKRQPSSSPSQTSSSAASRKKKKK